MVPEVIVGTDPGGVFLELKVLSTKKQAREMSAKLVAELANRVIRKGSHYTIQPAFALRAAAIVSAYFETTQIYMSYPAKQLLDRLSGRNGASPPPPPPRDDRRRGPSPGRRRPRGTAETVPHHGPSPYDTLFLTPEAPDDVVKAVHRALALANHPDRGGSDEAMKRINDAYDQIQRERGKNGRGKAQAARP